MTVERVIGKRNERGALAAERYVGRAKVRDSCDARAHSNDGAFTDLESGRSGASEIAERLALVEDRLTVIANEADALWSDLESLTRSKDRVGVDVSEAEVQLTQLPRGDGLLLGNT